MRSARLVETDLSSHKPFQSQLARDVMEYAVSVFAEFREGEGRLIGGILRTRLYTMRTHTDPKLIRHVDLALGITLSRSYHEIQNPRNLVKFKSTST